MELPKGGIIGKTAALIRRVQKMNIPNHAANAGYFIVLAVFPALVLILSVLRYTGLDAVDLMALVAVYIPDALEPALGKLLAQTYAYSGYAMVSVSAVTALWSASRGVVGVLRGLNDIYEVEERRGWLSTRLISMGYTVALIVVLVLTLALNVFGEQLLSLFRVGSWIWAFLSGIVDMNFLLMLAIQTAFFTAMYMFLPGKRNSFRSSVPGAVVASLGWQIFSVLFSLYVDNWSGYSNIYGSVYAVALAMLWLYCCLSILFYGAALNEILKERGEK